MLDTGIQPLEDREPLVPPSPAGRLRDFAAGAL
jgi:hypothetical protein